LNIWLLQAEVVAVDNGAVAEEVLEDTFQVHLLLLAQLQQ
jgi:hypothetical protein